MTATKSKLLNLGLILASLIGYLEWGQDNHMLLFQGEAEIISKLFTDPLAAVHPLTVLPLLGQILLVISLFQKRPGKVLTYTGMGCIGILLLFIFFIGIISLNVKIFFSAAPFLFLAGWIIWENRKKKIHA